MAERPDRFRLDDELGRSRTLLAGPEQFDPLDPVPSAPQEVGPPLLIFLGLGPEPAEGMFLVPPGATVYYVECPAFRRRLGPEWEKAVPPEWRELDPESRESLGQAVARGARIFLYRHGPRLFPSFWGPILGLCRLTRLCPGTFPATPSAAAREVILPAAKGDLLGPALAAAFQRADLTPLRPQAERVASELPRILAGGKPALFFSVNFKGLDPYGERFHLLDQAGVPVAAWCVDNPWHVLSGLKSPFWRQLHLFVTDASFIRPLKEHGAEHVYHLPLAACPDLFQPDPDVNYSDLAQRLLFVGRSEFPGKSGFFAACKQDAKLWSKAEAMVEWGERPDFDWWAREYGVGEMWPGTAVRQAGFGAEEAARHRRMRCIREAVGRLPVTAFGDGAWQELIPELTDVRPPVDYYGPLASAYRDAGCVLNVTSLLLPAGLTQRHFDVWTAGGVLATDASPGLGIFPRELTDPISFRRPSELPGLVKRLTDDDSLRQELSKAWRECILASHTYEHRVAKVLDTVDVSF
jgi:hypothetical protein